VPKEAIEKQNMFRLDILFYIDSNGYIVHTSFDHV